MNTAHPAEPRCLVPPRCRDIPRCLVIPPCPILRCPDIPQCQGAPRYNGPRSMHSDSLFTALFTQGWAHEVFTTGPKRTELRYKAAPSRLHPSLALVGAGGVSHSWRMSRTLADILGIDEGEPIRTAIVFRHQRLQRNWSASCLS